MFIESVVANAIFTDGKPTATMFNVNNTPLCINDTESLTNAESFTHE